MSSAIIQLIVLAAVAVFLLLRLRSVLGTRDGFERPPRAAGSSSPAPAEKRPQLAVIEGGENIADFVDPESDAARALRQMKEAEPGWSIRDFLEGAKAAYEMILMAYERGNVEEVRDLVDPEIYAAFREAVAEREARGLSVEAQFVGIRDASITDAWFDPESGEAEVTVSFTGELISTVRNAEGDIVEGSPTAIRRQKDVWTFARKMGSSDPNWTLVSTDG